jgi:hypothetical protein
VVPALPGGMARFTLQGLFEHREGGTVGSQLVDDHQRKRFNKRAAHWLKAHTVEWAILVVVCNLVAFVVGMLVFPNTTFALFGLLMFVAFLSSISDLAGVITDSGQDEKIEDLADDGEMNGS